MSTLPHKTDNDYACFAEFPLWKGRFNHETFAKHHAPTNFRHFQEKSVEVTMKIHAWRRRICLWMSLLGLWSHPLFVSANENSILVGVIPLLSALELNERFSPLLNKLEQALGQPVHLEVPANFSILLERLGKQEIDIAYVGPVPYLQITKQFGPHSILAMEELKGSKSYHGVIVVRTESPIQELGDLAGKRFAFGDPNSTMNHILPKSMLAHAGVGLKDLAEYAFVGNNQNVVLSVLMGQFDAAGVKEDIYNQYADRGIRIIARSQSVPNLLFVAGRHKSEEWVNKVRQTMYTLHQTPEGMAALKKFHPDATALVAADDQEFAPLRQQLREDAIK